MKTKFIEAKRNKERLWIALTAIEFVVDDGDEVAIYFGVRCGEGVSHQRAFTTKTEWLNLLRGVA